MPANSTPNATSAIARAASGVDCEARVPTHTNTPPTTARAACARRRSRIGPLKSTSSSIANEPNAAKVASIGLSNTRSPRANIAGITIAARAARRSAISPRSRVRSQSSERPPTRSDRPPPALIASNPWRAAAPRPAAASAPDSLRSPPGALHADCAGRQRRQQARSPGPWTVVHEPGSTDRGGLPPPSRVRDDGRRTARRTVGPTTMEGAARVQDRVAGEAGWDGGPR